MRVDARIAVAALMVVAAMAPPTIPQARAQAAAGTTATTPAPTPAPTPAATPTAATAAAAGPDLGNGGAPFSATLAIETPKPIGYGDEIVATLRLIPTRSFYVREIHLRPQGPLAYLYQDENAFACPLNQRLLSSVGEPLTVTCRLTSRGGELARQFGDKALLENKRLGLEAEIVVVAGPGRSSNHYVYANTELAPPKSHVVLGGFLGAALWALFLAISPPVAARAAAPAGTPADDNALDWSRLWASVRRALPQRCLDAYRLLAALGKQALIGGLTALVLIVVAKGTEGMQPPITVKIQDFWGGLMIGILSAPLAKWLREKFAAP